MNSKIIPLLIGLALLMGCDQPTVTKQVEEMAETTETITGQVMYRERKMLPPGAELIVTLEDVSKMDVASTVITSSSQVLKGAPPYDFSLTFAKSAIDERMRYSVRAKIKLADRLLFTSTEQLDPFKQADQPIAITLSMVSQNKAVDDIHSGIKTAMQPANELMAKADTGLAVVSVEPLSDLVNTYWKLISIGDQQISMDSKQQKEAFLQLVSENNSVKGFAGCNAYRGTYEMAGNALSFGAIASTKKACMAGMDTENSLMTVLNNTAHFSIHKNTLTLLNEQKKPTATFNAVYFN